MQLKPPARARVVSLWRPMAPRYTIHVSIFSTRPARRLALPLARIRRQPPPRPSLICMAQCYHSPSQEAPFGPDGTAPASKRYWNIVCRLCLSFYPATRPDIHGIFLSFRYTSRQSSLSSFIPTPLLAAGPSRQASPLTPRRGSMALRVFPPTVTQPRKSSLKKPKSSDAMVGEAKGVAFQVKPTTASPVIVQAADRHIKHALFCEPSSSSGALGSGSFRRQLRESRHSSVAASDVTSIRCDSPVDGNDDRLSPLPENSSFGSPSSRTRLSPGTERPAFPLNVSTEAQPSTTTPVSPSGDKLTALPETARFTPATSPPRADYPATTRSRPSTSPTLAYGWSPASSVPPYSPHDPARQPSIFPRWDPSKPLGQQQYYPHIRSSTPTQPISEKMIKGASSSTKRHTLPPLDLELVNPTATVVLGYEHIPVANSSDLLEVWNASCDKHPGTGRKALFRLIQPRNEGTALAIGVADDALLWSMKKNKPAVAAPDVEPPELLMISKHPPGNPDVQTVAQLALPDGAPPDQSAPAEDDYVSIFPHMAAINAIDAVANSPEAAAIAQADPTAKSPEAAKLAQDAVSAAHQRCRSVLVRTTRERDGLGAVTATYRLEHPTLCSFPLTVTKSKEGRYARDPRANISLHHPSATPAAVAAETLVLAFLDFARDACVLDVPGLLALEGSYIIDTVMCALLAVAVIENDALKGKRMTFDAPPKSPLPVAKRESRAVSVETNTTKESRRSNGLLRRNKKKRKEEIELPVLTQGALALLGFSFKVAVWTLELGVKATAGVIIGTSHVMSKA
ncbi:hypothetical protein BDY17DRAFT_290175 [Neohortaea acidophila]|uniref:Uncharacterized protein n=1 Tax=Neohortaea acidophila TaxID=245834 RepID=A0A6A6Q7K3_9PEZI|nr:uncharacterized protein BDY17DRAFT_290175 [Neohortaea acidophila]KAF2488051.1 hypothetical protein BDY17DRAFT_290175 [Neohortaea acidophila]